MFVPVQAHWSRGDRAASLISESAQTRHYICPCGGSLERLVGTRKRHGRG